MLGQDVSSHQSVIDSVTTKGRILESSNVSAKLDQLKTRYLSLCDAVKDHVRDCEDYVSNHQKYSDLLAQCREWLHSVSDRLDVCSETSADKHSIHNKLDRIEAS